eukprot:3163813-Rhodomonas_salina.1
MPQTVSSAAAGRLSGRTQGREEDHGGDGTKEDHDCGGRQGALKKGGGGKEGGRAEGGGWMGGGLAV